MLDRVNKPSSLYPNRERGTSKGAEHFPELILNYSSSAFNPPLQRPEFSGIKYFLRLPIGLSLYREKEKAVQEHIVSRRALKRLPPQERDYRS